MELPRDMDCAASAEVFKSNVEI